MGVNAKNRAWRVIRIFAWQVHAGFKEVRMVPGKVGIAFIEFDDEHKATTALQSLNGFKLTPTDTMALSYAKR